MFTRRPLEAVGLLGHLADHTRPILDAFDTVPATVDEAGCQIVDVSDETEFVWREERSGWHIGGSTRYPHPECGRKALASSVVHAANERASTTMIHEGGTSGHRMTWAPLWR